MAAAAQDSFFFWRGLYAFPPKRALGYEAAPFPPAPLRDWVYTHYAKFHVLSPSRYI